MGVTVQNCPGCGRSHTTASPGEPCSSRCAATVAARSAKASSTLPAQTYGRHRAEPPPRRQSGRGCSLSLLVLAAGAGGLVAAAVDLARAVL